MKKNILRPEWAPENAGSEFASHLIPPVGANSIRHQSNSIRQQRKELPLQEYKDGILAKDKTILARAITLIESNAEKHFELAQELIKEVLPHTGKSVRIGITGVPGAGKSTFIEAFGLFLIENKKHPAILAIDPSSTVSRGSILGDKTRMEHLSRHEKAFIRPSPSGGNLGGVARKTKETLLLCEAAGFDIILIETVGVGQSEVTVRSMVDFFLLILISGAGDELQGIKKGVIELADAILINKADGDNIISADRAKTEYNNALHYLADATPGWKTQAHTCSAIENKGIDNIWQVINDFLRYTKKTGIFKDRRLQQTKTWFENMLHEEVLNQFYKNEAIKSSLPTIIDEIIKNKITPVVGVKKMIELS
jgi:LAO/AO transport system kinase